MYFISRKQRTASSVSTLYYLSTIFHGFYGFILFFAGKAQFLVLFQSYFKFSIQIPTKEAHTETHGGKFWHCLP